MPYKDPERQRAAVRESKARARERAGIEAESQAVAEHDAGVQRVIVPPPSKEELLSLLGRQARLGSVRAIDLLLKREDANAGNADSDPLSDFDQLAKRRAVGA